MADVPPKEQECREDVLRRLQKLLDMLEGRVDVLHEMPEMKNMRPGECEQAIDRHIVLMLRILQMRQQFAQAGQKVDRQEALHALFLGEGDD